MVMASPTSPLILDRGVSRRSLAGGWGRIERNSEIERPSTRSTHQVRVYAVLPAVSQPGPGLCVQEINTVNVRHGTPTELSLGVRQSHGSSTSIIASNRR